MALNQADSIAVRAVIRDRVTSACVAKALYLLGTPTPTPQELSWSRGTMDAPASMGERVSWYVLTDANFLTNGSSITDQQLADAVGTAVDVFFIPNA